MLLALAIIVCLGSALVGLLKTIVQGGAAIDELKRNHASVMKISRDIKRIEELSETDPDSNELKQLAKEYVPKGHTLVAHAKRRRRVPFVRAWDSVKDFIGSQHRDLLFGPRTSSPPPSAKRQRARFARRLPDWKWSRLRRLASKLPKGE